MSDLPDFKVMTLGSPSITNPMASHDNVTFIEDSERLLFDPHIGRDKSLDLQHSLEVAGPRKALYFQPGSTRAAIVTCGGLCPGLNAVIRGLVLELWYTYNCKDILGIRFGYQGFAEDAQDPVPLTPDIVSGIREDGGTWLGSSRGTPPVEMIVDKLEAMGINQFFTIGGDGTMRGAHRITEEIQRRGLNISVIGIPKTIDNDIPFVRRSFGFESAVSEGAKALNCAEVESKGMPNGIGLVKLMGRHAGFIAATATIASGNVNFCLIPEVPFSLEGPGGFFELLEKRMEERKHAVVVVAEGAGQEYFDVSKLPKDASGNQKLGDIGIYLKDRIIEHFKEKGITVNMKYIDPSYLIRALSPNATDQLYADRLARMAVHAAMAGKTGMLIGHWHGQLTHVPMSALEGRSSNVKRDGELWLNVRENTGQPDFMGR